MITPSEQVLHEWARTHFAGAELSRVKQIDRVITIAEAMAQSPGATLPQMFAHPYDLKAAYKFFADPEATPDQLQAGHRESVLWEMEKPGLYLLIEDTSEIRCTDKAHPMPGLGPIGASKKAEMGFHLHSVLAVKWPEHAAQAAPRRPAVTILGLADQQYHVRQPRPANEPSHSSARRIRPTAQLESVLWEQACVRLGPAPEDPDVIWVKVGDRGSDIFDHRTTCQSVRQRFVLRASKDRALVDAAGRPAGKLVATARASASLGTVALDLRARPGQPARQAQLALSVTTVRLRSPQRAGHGPGVRPPLTCAVVRVWEPQPPAGVTPLEWMLLTDLPVETFAQVCQVAQSYATRWLEEEFHKALKTGMNVEALQLETAHEWFAATALLSVAALRLLELREIARLTPEAPAAQTGLSEMELQVLAYRVKKPLQTVRDAILGLGRLGGHLNRKGDGLPGWITLWRGWQYLQTLVEGALIARHLNLKPD